nr:hypothetical protein [Tolivirales sp.]
MVSCFLIVLVTGVITFCLGLSLPLFLSAAEVYTAAVDMVMSQPELYPTIQAAYAALGKHGRPMYQILAAQSFGKGVFDAFTSHSEFVQALSDLRQNYFADGYGTPLSYAFRQLVAGFMYQNIRLYRMQDGTMLLNLFNSWGGWAHAHLSTVVLVCTICLFKYSWVADALERVERQNRRLPANKLLMLVDFMLGELSKRLNRVRWRYETVDESAYRRRILLAQMEDRDYGLLRLITVIGFALPEELHAELYNVVRHVDTLEERRMRFQHTRRIIISFATNWKSPSLAAAAAIVAKEVCWFFDVLPPRRSYSGYDTIIENRPKRDY